VDPEDWPKDFTVKCLFLFLPEDRKFIYDNYQQLKGKNYLHVVGPVVMVWENCWCEDTRRALVTYFGTKNWTIDTEAGGYTSSMQSLFFTDHKSPEGSDSNIPTQCPIVPFGENKAILSQEPDPDDQIIRALRDLSCLMDNLPINAVNQVLADIWYMKRKIHHLLHSPSLVFQYLNFMNT
jgi:hypothetical protein